jgi:glycosyltransferase involved in cell wall biosynthesis
MNKNVLNLKNEKTKGKTKILMIANCPRELECVRGGVEAVIVNLLKGFCHLNFDIEVYVVSIRKELIKEEKIKYSKNIILHYIPFGFPGVKNFEYIFHGKYRIKRIIKQYRPNIIHIQGTGPNLLYISGCDKRNVVATQHGIVKEEYRYQEGAKNRIKFCFKVKIENFLLPKLKNLIFISQYNKNLYTINGFKLNSIKYELIYNPVNDNFFSIGNDISNKSENRLIYVGVLSKLKGLLGLLKALYELKGKGYQFHLDIIGGFVQGEYKNQINTFIKEKGIQEQLTFHDWKKQSEIINLMKKANIFVLPSSQETFPVSIAEAMAAGKVVVASNVGGVSEMFVNKESGFIFKKEDISELIDILKYLYNNSKEINRVSKNAKIFAKKRYYSASVAKQTYEFYKKIIGKLD